MATANSSKFCLTKEEAEKQRKWLIVDASGVPVGRLASEIASLLRGKHKQTYTPHVDCGDYVIVLNADKVRFTGKKLENKHYYHHSGYAGGIKSISAEKLLDKNPQKVIKLAVEGMLQGGPLGHKLAKKLKVFRGVDHPHGAQNPELISLKYSANI
jgi:large subunit ribosomal protein L13